jgi:nickel/cobalt transporter (NiCoT) family protein
MSSPSTHHSPARQPAGRHPLLLPLLGVAALHIVGFGLLLMYALPSDLRLGSGEIFGLGIGFTAYTLGMRHAFDADHIATIDNTTRKLLHDGERPHATGFFFSAGHSTVVFLLAILVALGVRGIGTAVADEDSTLHEVTSVWGPTVAGLFLFVIGIVNLGVVRQTLRLARRANAGELGASEMHALPTGRGPISALTQRLAARVSRPWQLYPVGFAFGFGFDTATEIALLVLAGGSAAGGLPVGAILCLPILFAAGMTLLDTLNGAATARAYSWALNAPARRVAYNVAVTGVSVVFALTIGSLSLLGVLVDEFAIDGGPLAAIAAIDTQYLGYALLSIILLSWTAAALWARSVERRFA